MKTFKEIDIKYYDNSGNVQVRCTVPVTQEALVHYELMQSHYCKLSFKLSRPTYFLLGDFIETPYGRFELIDLTKAKDNDTIGYSYEIQFDAYYRKLKNKILKYRPNTGSQEATFSLTSKISTQIEVIMKNLAYYAKLDKSYLYDPNFEGEGTDYTYVIDASVDANAAKLITYSNSSILDAIANIAQTFGCEWWFEGNILHFGTCENTNAITDFRLNDNIVSMSSSQSQSTYANRVYAFGAARNLPSGYKNDSDADITKDGVVEKRLMLPTSAECSEQNKQMLAENGFELKNGYIQVGGLREDQYVEGVTTNDDIYPRNLIKTSKVTSYEKDVEDENTPEEGDYIKRTFYRVNSLTIVNDDGEKTGDMAFRKAYILSGKNLHIVFQSGSLNGMDFECEFNPDGVPEILLDDDGNPIFKDGKEQINPKSQVFEIVANEDYGRFLPDTTLHPKDGDTFVLYNWNSTKLGDALVPSASNELLADAIKNLKKSVIDPTTYTCTAEDNYSYNHGRGNLHGVGDRVNLYNKGYGDGYRSSRVIGYEFSLDIPFDGAKYYVGEKPSYSRLNAMESKIEELIYNGQSYLNGNGGSGRSIYIIKSYDSITPTDYNVFSAKAVDEQRLNKIKDDTAKGTITWEKVQKLLSGLLVGNFNNENGGSWTPDTEGRSHLITDYLEVRMKAIFEELVIKKTSTIGGKEIISPAGGVVAHKVEEVTVTYNNVSQKAYRCYFLAEQEGDAVDNDFAIGDQVRSESFNVRKGTYHKVGNHFYWRLVIGRDEDPVGLEGKKYHYIDLSDTDCATASDVPAKGDVLSQCGNRTDVERQNCLIFSAVDTYSPSISLYHGINSYSFANREYVQYGVNKQTSKAFFNVYGDMYVGDRPTKENGYEGSSYIKYDSATKQVSVKGKISAKSTVDGKELSQYIKENSAKGLTEEQVNNLIKNSQVITDLQNQVDGAIETWFYDGVPTLKNAPASSWTTDKEKDTHLGDLYYDNKTGKAYRFAKDGNTYKWTIITDTDIAKALSDASKAQETADGKMKVFSTQPIPPYQLGDIWVNATYPTDGSIYKNEILRCQTAKAKGSSFAIADWTKASKYTDDSALNTFKEEYKNDMASYKEQLDEKVETWFYNYAPTTKNKPASDWTTDTLKSQHAGDLFYNTSNGYTYRWTGTAWARIKDNDINTAMTAASKAQDTADGKRTVFTSQPTVPYDEGDLWASGGDDGKTLMVCIKGRTTGSFTSSEWVKANDSDLNAFAKTIEESLNGIRDQLDKKAETWYQPSDPSASWTTDDAKKEHKGDLWYNTSNNQTFFWNGTKWDKQDVPTEVFDKIDGKSSIYVSKPASYEERDLWILEAAYTLGGVAYSKGELVVATKSNASFSAADWTKKVKYTDDTVANAAKKAAEEAKKAADTAQTNVTNLGKTVTSNKKAFDNYVTDGYLEPSEIAAMAQDSKRLEDAFAAAEKSYNEVKGAEVLKSTKELTDLNTAFTTLSTAKTELVTYLSDISTNYNKADTNGKATIVSAVGTKFTNFQSAYSAFYDKLGLANAYITSKIYSNLGVVIGDVTSLAYLKKALMDAPDTEINGGLILTSLIGLRDTDGNTTAGINGITEKSAKGGGIAAWFGGEMVDKDYNDGSKTPANTIFRFDGSGYVAGGAIWWGTDGRVHADPTSFVISEKNLGAYLTFFEPTWKEGSAGTSVADLVSLKPNAPFSKLGVSGDATFEGAISFHGIKLTYDSTNKAIKIDGNLYATGGITAFGASSVSGGTGSGLNGSVLGFEKATAMTSADNGDSSKTEVSFLATAWSIKQLNDKINAFGTGVFSDYLTIAAAKATYQPKGSYLTSHQTIYGLTIQKNGTSLGTYTPNSAAKTINVTVPTKLSELSNDSGYTKNTGTVTSVAISVPTGLSVSGSPITTNGTIAIALASGYSIPTTAKQTAWDGAVSAKHTHSNKSVLDGISSTMVSHWNSAYDWYALMTTDEETADGIINKWNEVVSFLANIAQTDTLSGIVDGINKSISDEVARAKKAEGVNASGISANKGSIATLQGYFTNGSAKKALQLTNARKLWGNSFNGTADINGSIIVPSGKYISIGNIKLEYDAANKALKITNTTTEEVANLYTSGGVSAYGVGASSSSGGGLNGSVKAYADAIRLTTENLSEIASAYSVAKLYSEIQNVASAVPSISVSVPTGGNALTGATYDASTGVITFAKGTFLTAHQSLDGYVNAIAVSGSGNAVTAVTKSGKTITFTKGATYLTSHQSLSNYYTKSSVDSLLNGKSATTHTHSVKINGITKTIAASGGDAVDLGTYLTAHQSLAAYATQNWVKNEATAHNADMVDNYHASGLFTGFSISDVANKVTISIGGTSKALNLVRAFPSGVGNNFNDIATHGNSMGMSNIAAPYASSTANYQTLNGYVNPNGQTGWHHYINLSYTDSNNTATSPNMWQTQFAIKAGTTEVYVRSRAGGKISNDAAWAAPWVRLARVTDNVASASKVANALSWSGYSSGSYNGSAAKSISIPNNTNQLTNGAGFITSSASITGNAGSATKLQNARTINGTSFNGTANIVTSYWGTTRKLWGNSVNGNADVNGSITIANTDGVYVQIGDVRLVYDKANTAIKVVKSDGTTAANFYATGGISAYGEGSAGTTGSNNFSAKAYADSIKLTSENLSEIASAYSIAVLNNSLNAAIGRISTLEGGSATSIETTGSGNAVTSVSKSGTKITFTKGSTFSLNGHTHDFITVGANQTITATQYTKSRLSVRPYCNSGGPTTYGNILEVVSGNSGGGQLGMEWSGSQTKTDGTDTNVGKLYYRSKRDNMAGWTVWKRLAFAEELAWGNISGKPTSLSGYGITDGVNAVSVTGSGNAVTAASVSGHTLTLTKGSTFSLSNHTHYVGTTQVQGSSAEQALTGITKIDNILKLSKATVTVNTSYKAEQNRLVIYGNTYGNDANYIKSARKLSYGDGGPQLVFSTSENPDASGVQSAALVYTDHDTIGAGVSLSFVTNQGDAYFIAPHIKALTAFQGNLAWSYITNKPTTLSGFGITDGLRSVTHPSGSNVFVTGISTSGTAITYTKSYTKKSLSAVGTSGWTNASIDGNIIPDMSFIAHWNGAYSGTSSNLAYCNKGAFGSFAIKNSLAFSELTSKPTTISGYGITDAYTKSQVDAIAAKYLPLTGGTLTGQLKIVASALNGAYNGLLIGDDCYIGDCNFANTIGLMGSVNSNAGMVKFGKGGMQFGYNGSNHIASTTAQWTNLNADLLDGWHKDNIVWSGAVNSNTANLSHYWAKLFDITVTDNLQDDRSFTFLFSNGYNDTYSVVVLRIRQNGAKGSGAYNFNIALRELVGNMSSRLRVYYDNATGNVQLWGNCQDRYGCLSYTIIKKTGRASADFTSQGTLVTNTSFSAAQSLPATTGDSPYSLLDGATRIGIVKQADQLVTARSLWGQSFNGTANVSGNMTGVGNINTSAAPAGTIYTNNWFRSKGSTGWYSEDHGGGWYMTDNTWIRNFGGKDVYLSNKLSVNGNVGIGTTAPSHKLHVSGEIYTTTKVNINGIVLEKDSDGNLKVNGNLYATGGISAYGTSSAGSGGGLSGSVLAWDSAIKMPNATNGSSDTTKTESSFLASAWSIKQLYNKVTSLEGGSAMNVSVSGSGNAVTSISKSGTTISVVKGSTFLTAHQSLAGYMKTATADAKYMYHSRNNIVSDLNSFATDGAAHIYEMNNVTNRPNRNSWVQVMNWGTGDSAYGFLLANDYSTNGHMYFRQKIAGSWKDWKTIIDSSNIGSQSVNYAASAGSVAWTNVSGRPSTMKNPSALSWSGYSSGSYDGSAAKSISIPNNTNQLTNGAGFITASASITGNAATATKVNHSLSVFGKSFNGSADVTVADTDLIASISTATANLTDKTEILTSYASDNGFNDSNAKNRIYRRPASAIWGYINSKTISNADKLDNVHLNGIFTALSNTNNGVSMTIGTVAKSLANMQVYSATKLATARNIALGHDFRGSANFDGTGNITINGHINAAIISLGPTDPSPFKRIAHVQVSGSWNDNALLLYLSQGYIGGFFGICRVEFRTNESEAGSASASVKWLFRHGYATDYVQVGFYSAKHNSYMDVFVKTTGGYQGTVIRCLQDSRGSINSNVSLLKATATTEAYTSIEAAATALYKLAYTAIVKGSDAGAVNYANSAGNAGTLDGIHANGLFTNLSNNGNNLSITIGGTNKTLTVGYATKAAQLNTARTLWGQSFDGTGNVNGALSGATTISASNTISTTLKNGALKIGNKSTPISAIDDEVIFNTGGAIRFGETAWDFNQWAGLKYNHSSKTIYLGIADGSVFNANSAQSGGKLKLINCGLDVPDNIATSGILTVGKNIRLINMATNVSALFAQLNGESLSIGYGSRMYATTQMWCNKFAIYCNEDIMLLNIDKVTATFKTNILATGGVTAYASSDARLKTDLRKLDYLGIIKAMGGTFGFAWKKDNTRSIGWIAQHVLCNPHLKDIVETDEKGYYKINYWSPKLIATAFGAIEQVGDEVSRLKARVVFLESEVQRLSGKQDGNNKKRLDNKNINLLN